MPQRGNFPLSGLYCIIFVVPGVETHRNQNLWYLPKPNILLNAKYSANCRIIGCRIVPTQQCQFATIRFRQNIRLDILQNISAEIGFGRTLIDIQVRHSCSETVAFVKRGLAREMTLVLENGVLEMIQSPVRQIRKRERNRWRWKTPYLFFTRS